MITIKAIGFYTDGYDGGGGFTVYNDKEHYIADMLEMKKGMGEYAMTREEIEANWDRAASEEDPYEDGELAPVTIKIKEKDGKYQLAEPIDLHWGQ